MHWKKKGGRMLFSSQNRKKCLGQDLETAIPDGGLKICFLKFLYHPLLIVTPFFKIDLLLFCNCFHFVKYHKSKLISKKESHFRIYDMDGDGYISNGELFQVLKMMVGSNLKDTQLQQIVDKTILFADKVNKCK